MPKLALNPITAGTQANIIATLFPPKVPVFSKTKRDERVKYKEFLTKPQSEYEKLLARI